MDWLLQLVEANEQIEYSKVWLAVGVYFTAIWIIVAIWVQHNATHRYKRKSMGALWGILVAVLNLPALFIYLLVRPESPNVYHSEFGEVILPIKHLNIGDNITIKLQVTAENQAIVTDESRGQTESSKSHVDTQKQPQMTESKAEKSKPAPKQHIVEKSAPLHMDNDDSGMQTAEPLQ